MAFNLETGIKDTFAAFFEDPTRANLRALIQNHSGEALNFDFKEDWPTSSRLAKQVLGLMNADDGCIIVGVRENDDKTLDPCGLANLTDKAEILKGLASYLPHPTAAQVKIHDFSYSESEYPKIIGKLFQVMFIQHVPEHVPVVCPRDGDGLRKSAVYIRREAVTEECTYEELQSLIQKHVSALSGRLGELSIAKHLSQLKELYDAANVYDDAYSQMRSSLFLGLSLRTGTGKLPKESLSDFILALIDMKKSAIAKAVGLGGYVTMEQIEREVRRKVAKKADTTAIDANATG